MKSNPPLAGVITVWNRDYLFRFRYLATGKEMDGQVQLLESVFQSGSCWLECRSDGWSAEDILDHILRILNEIEGVSVFDNHGMSVPDLIGTQAGSIVRHKRLS